MGLTQDDREWIRAVVKAAVEETSKQFVCFVHTTIAQHAEKCSYPREQRILLIGVAVGVAIVAADGVLRLVSLIGNLL